MTEAIKPVHEKLREVVAIANASMNDLSAEAVKVAAINKLLLTQQRETFEALAAMRDTINEVIPMPSLEADLLQGPEISVTCANIAEAVFNHTRETNERSFHMLKSFEQFTDIGQVKSYVKALQVGRRSPPALHVQRFGRAERPTSDTPAVVTDFAARGAVERGVDEKKTPNSDYTTYRITVGDHENQIEVHGDESLRDTILTLLSPPQPAPSAQEAVAWTPQHCLDDIASGRSQMLPAYKSPGDADRTSWVPLFLSPPSPAHGALTALREGIERGVDEKKTRNSDYVTYGITIGDHENKIEVHGDPALRNLILDLLRPYAFPVR